MATSVEKEENAAIENMSAVDSENNTGNKSWYSFSKFTWLEVSGSCGDFGTLFPLLVALAREEKIHLAPTLFLTGLVHLINGYVWDLPMPLQPMHMISAQAISGELNQIQVSIAGIGMGVCFFLLQFGGIGFLHWIIPKSVIGGLQLGVGWKLAMKGISMIQDLPWWGTLDCIAVAIMVTFLLLFGLRPSLERKSQSPVGIYIFLLGLVLATWKVVSGTEPSQVQKQSEPLLVNALKDATWEDVSRALLSGTLPQVPLTLLNSCLSVCLLAHTLFPEQAPNKITHTFVCRSIGLMDALLCPFGMMPHCHGAGGLAVQHRLGAKSGASMIALGIFKVFLSLFAAQGSLLVLLDALPVSILGLLLALSGHELATTGVMALVEGSRLTTPSTGNEQLIHDVSIALVTGVVIVATGGAHIGSLCGWLTYVVYGTGFNDLFCSSNARQQDNAENCTREQNRGIYSPLETSTIDEECHE